MKCNYLSFNRIYTIPTISKRPCGIRADENVFSSEINSTGSFSRPRAGHRHIYLTCAQRCRIRM